ncbi:MAG: DUF1292 domain-containing protein [Clostridiales bacterium]|jgi:uncharacterized protein YrzB (UPF0473 family)|nr:DUF1292 domain-containing protein [Clostridiales bacterium]
MSDFDDFEDLDDTFDMITMTGDDGEEIEFAVVDSVEMDGDTYLLLIQNDELEDDEAEAYIFKQVESDGEDVVFEEPNEEEFEKVSKIFRDASEDFDIED